MKKYSKILVLALTVVLAINALCISAFAASTKPGTAGSVSYTFEDVYGLDGTVSVSGTDIFSDYTISVTSDGDGVAVASGNTLFCFGLDSEADSYVVTIDYVVKAGAAEGATANFVFNGSTCTTITSQGEMNNVAQEDLKLASVTASATGAAGVNYTELEAQIAAAKAYMAEAKDVEGFVNALNKADALLNGNATQAEVDAAATTLKSAIEALKKAMANGGKTEIVTEIVTQVVEKEVIKEVPVEKIVEVPADPTDPFCNKGVHTVFLVLFIVFAIATTALTVLYAIGYGRKKNNRKDTTPLVNYNIEDDDK